MKAKCHQCEKPAIKKYGNMPLCVDCYRKMVEADFMVQQISHNQLSWLASRQHLIQQRLSDSTGGLLTPRYMPIPQPPLAPINYTYTNIKVSDSAIGVINPGTLYTIDTSIEAIQNRGEPKLAEAVKELTQAVLDDKQITDDLRNQLVEQLEFLVAEAVADKEKRHVSVIKGVMEQISKAITVSAALLTIWGKVGPLFQANFGF